MTSLHERDESGVSDPPVPARPTAAAPSSAAGRGSFLSEWPFVVVLVVAVAGMAVIAFLDRFRRGSVLFGGSLALAGLLRMLLPERSAGLLAVRSKGFDVLAYIALGVAIAVLAVVTPADTPA